MYLSLVSVVVEDYDAAIDFFTGVLGFELAADEPAFTSAGGRPKRWVVVRPPGAQTGVLLARADGEEQVAAVGHQTGGRVGFFLEVDDFDARYARLSAAGVRFVRPPRSEPYGRVAVFLDIAGNKWDLLGPAEPRGRLQSAPRHDRDAGGPPDVLAAKAALRQDVWDAMRAAKVARFPGAEGRIPNFIGAEAAAERLRAMPQWQAATTVKANPDSAQLPVRQRALEDGKTVYMAVPRLAEPEPFFALDPDALTESPRKAASIRGATRSAKRVALAELSPVDLVVMGSVAASEDGARLGKGGGFADLEFALATAAGLIGPRTVCVTTVHEIQVQPAGTIPLTDHDVPVDFVITPDRVIDCRDKQHARPTAGIHWVDLTDEKIAAIPLLTALRQQR